MNDGFFHRILWEWRWRSAPTRFWTTLRPGFSQPLSENREPRLEWMPLGFRRDKTALIVDRRSYQKQNCARGRAVLIAGRSRAANDSACSSESNQTCSVGAIEAIAKWKGALFFFEPPHRKLVGEPFHDLFVLFRLETTGAVNEDTARSQEGRGGTNNFQLPFLHVEKVRRSLTPAHIHTTTHRSGIAAGRVHEDAVEGGMSGDFLQHPLAFPIAPVRPGNGDAK